MTPRRTTGLLASVAALTMVFATVTVDYAEARRGGSFGSRGSRTYQSAPATNTAPAAAPVQRSMTSPGQANAGAAAAAPAAGARSGLFGGGFGGAMMRGLLIGGLFGVLMGSGFGGLAGMFGFLIQALLIGLLVWFAIRLFRRRSGQPATANVGGNGRSMYEGTSAQRPGAMGGSGGGGARMPGAMRGTDTLKIGPADLDTFEQRLVALQAAFSRDDYDALREVGTPEVVSYLSEELAQNAARGVRTEATDVRLEQGDVAESWREGTRDYATVAMRYSMVEVTRERDGDRILEGDPNARVESTEVWTFVRERGAEWKLSAIQGS